MCPERPQKRFDLQRRFRLQHAETYKKNFQSLGKRYNQFIKNNRLGKGTLWKAILEGVGSREERPTQKVLEDATELQKLIGLEGVKVEEILMMARAVKRGRIK